MEKSAALLARLMAATPRKSVLGWLVMTLLYCLVIIVNDYFDLLATIGISLRTTAIIKLAGVFCYIFLTTYSYQNTNSNETTDDIKITDQLDPAAGCGRNLADASDAAHASQPDTYGSQSGSAKGKPATITTVKRTAGDTDRGITIETI